MSASDAATNAYIITGPTAGVGRETALAFAGLGTLVLAGRSTSKLEAVKKEVERRGGRAFTVLCDMANLPSVRAAAKEILDLGLPIVGLINNAGIQNPPVATTAEGWDMTFVTNHLGPFALTEGLVPHLEDGASVLFLGSATEDPERKPAVRGGFRGGRYLSAEASLHGEWKPGGSARPTMDAYATSKQCNIVTAMVFARENPRLHVNALEPGIMFGTGLHANMPRQRLITMTILATLLRPFVGIFSTPRRAGRVICKIVTDPSGPTGLYYDESGHPMQGSQFVRDPEFQERVVAETRTLLTTLQK